MYCLTCISPAVSLVELASSLPLITVMDYQSSESFCGFGNTVTHSTPTSERNQGGDEDTTESEEKTVIGGERKNDVPDHSWRSNSSESDWMTTTDTSVHSSLSTTRSAEALEVPFEVLEACDGMDDACYYPTSEVRLGKGKVIGQTVARKSRKGSSSSDDSGSASSSYDTAFSSSSSSSCRHSSSCSCSSRSTGSDSSSSCRHSSSCSCSHSSSCSCSSRSTGSDSSSSCSEHSRTSFESTDDLTELPRAKTRARRLGKMACKKVADKCNQS